MGQRVRDARRTRKPLRGASRRRTLRAVPLPRRLRQPSVVRDFVRPLLAQRSVGGVGTVTKTWGPDRQPETSVLLTLCEQLDERLLAEHFDTDRALTWELTLTAIRSALRWWESGVKDRGLGDGAIVIRPGHPAELVLQLLEGCPDAPTPEALSRLTFVRDEMLRESIARDVDSVDRLLKAEEWKAATVVGGGVLEAILLDRLESDDSNRERAKAYMDRKKWKGSLGDWKLGQLIDAAVEMGIVRKDIGGVLNGARAFRNLIHAGRERIEAPCNRATAYTAYAAIQHLLNEFDK